MKDGFIKSFTLIELLVVIAIIGILSALIVVAMNGATEKANVAKSQVFSNSLRNALSQNLISEWKLNIDATDSWGNNSGTLVGASIVSDSVRGPCLSLAGTESSYFIKNPYNGFPATEITFELWVKTTDAQSSGIISYATSHSDNDFLLISPNSISIYLYGSAVGTGVKVNDGLWHNLVVSWDASGAFIVYLDGKNKSSGNLAPGGSFLDGGSLVFGQDQDSIGGGFTASQAFAGLIDEARLYGKIVPASQIKEQYYAGLNKRLAIEELSQSEYRQRTVELQSD